MKSNTVSHENTYRIKMKKNNKINDTIASPSQKNMQKQSMSTIK
jgi:hypothetical protein